MSEKIIKKELSKKILMAGNYFKNHHPGGISAVVQYWNDYIEDLQYYPTYKLSNVVVRAWWFAFSYLRLALRMLMDKHAAVLHLHTAADGSFWRKAQLVELGGFFNRKVVMHVHASRFKGLFKESSEKKRAWILHTLQSVDKLIVLSNSWKDWFEQIGVPKEKIVVLHNITPYPQKNSSASVNDGKVHFLFMGEIGPRKGVFDILRAMAKHRTELIGKVELRIGGNRNEDQLRQLIKDEHLEDMVFFEGWVGGEKKIHLLNWMDVFILPSYNEGLPISILEAMSYGCPIISTPVGGIPEVVETDVNGVLVSPGNMDEIYSAMEKYVRNKEQIAIEGLESEKKSKMYLPDYVLNELKHIYESIIDA